jgi:hypothetical protein
MAMWHVVEHEHDIRVPHQVAVLFAIVAQGNKAVPLPASPDILDRERFIAAVEKAGSTAGESPRRAPSFQARSAASGKQLSDRGIIRCLALWPGKAVQRVKSEGLLWNGQPGKRAIDVLQGKAA